MNKLLLFVFLLAFLPLEAQQSISFLENALESALDRAKEEGKDVFLDSYAPWCKPCKKMDRVFRNGKVATFYNDNFINVKINVDQALGKSIADRYGIAFLPTMLVIDANGYVKQRIDGVMNADQMLEIGQAVVSGKSLAIVETEPKKVRKLSKKVNAENIPVAEPGEKILFVLDDPNATDNPEYLYHEAFFRFQQMDGSHDSIATKYLATQEDWSTEKNLNFISNFLDNTNSEMFTYFAENAKEFSSVMGAEQYRKTLEILINDCLYRQIPRPTPEKVESLFSLLYPRKAEKYTYQYLLKRYEDEEKYDEYVSTGEDYLETLIKPDAELLYKLGKYKCLNADKKELKECVFRVEESIRISKNPDYDQYLTLAKLYLKLGKERKALDMAEKSKVIGLGDTEAQRQVDLFIKKLEKS